MVIAITNVFSQENILEEANTEYKKGNYEKSIVLYDSLLTKGYYSPELYYNLGNSFYKKNDYGKAILYYEKALKYKPNDEDIKHNIFLVKRKIDSEIIELPDFFLNRWWKEITNVFSLETWGIFSLLLAVILAVIFGLYWFKNYSFKGLFPLMSSFIFILILFTIFASFSRKKTIYNSDKCILTKPDSLFMAPDKRSDLLYNLEPGEKFKLIDSINTWYKVKLVNKETGWINRLNCEKI